MLFSLTNDRGSLENFVQRERERQRETETETKTYERTVVLVDMATGDGGVLDQAWDWFFGTKNSRRKCSPTPTQLQYWGDFVDSFTASLINGGRPQDRHKEREESVGTREQPEEGTGARRESKRANHQLPVSYVPAAKRVIAIGDLHGDFDKAVRAFSVAGLVDEQLNWSGGETVAVQVGDVLDRGGEEIRIFHLLEKLKRQAKKQGGALHVLNGNHEIMNVAGRFRYATRRAMDEFYRWEAARLFGMRLKCLFEEDQAKCELGVSPPSPSGVEARRKALQPGGDIAKSFLSQNPVALVVGSTVFVHGGLHPEHMEYGIERMNRETSLWIRGEAWRQDGDENGDGDAGNPGYSPSSLSNVNQQVVPWFLSGRNAIVWSRMYSNVDEKSCNCEMLQEALSKGPRTRRMVVGHTVQYPMGINGACNHSVFRVDVGLSRGIVDAQPEVLEIIDDKVVRRLRAYEPDQVLVSEAQGLQVRVH